MKIENKDGGKFDFPTILESLKIYRILTIKKSGDKFELRDGCDDYFWVKLTKEQFEKLIEEMKELL
jgi:hypothetical protein